MKYPRWVSHRYHKPEVDYSPGREQSHCGPVSDRDRYYCVHYVANNKCELVQGLINKKYWCKLFKKVT